MAVTLLAVAAGLAGVGVLVFLQRSHHRRVRAERRALLDGVARSIDDVVVSQEGIGFPALSGSHRGHRVKIELLADTLNLRQLPRLWLVVSLFRPTGMAAAVDIVRDPQIPDNVSPTERLAHEHAVPDGWPGPLRIATAGPAAPDLRPFQETLGLLRDTGTKEVLAGPGGVRIVHELARGELGQWRVVRRAKFDVGPPDERVAALLDAAHELAQRLERSGSARMCGIST